MKHSVLSFRQNFTQKNVSVKPDKHKKAAYYDSPSSGASFRCISIRAEPCASQPPWSHLLRLSADMLPLTPGESLVF